jgi:hypothetical protein
VLFSPGAGNSRLIYGGIVEAVASAGFAVISVDHPYDADIVVFPDGSIVYGTVNDDTNEEIEQALAVRVADVRFVLDRALTPNAVPVLPPIDIGKVGILDTPSEAQQRLKLWATTRVSSAGSTWMVASGDRSSIRV